MHSLCTHSHDALAIHLALSGLTVHRLYTHYVLTMHLLCTRQVNATTTPWRAAVGQGLQAAGSAISGASNAAVQGAV